MSLEGSEGLSTTTTDAPLTDDAPVWELEELRTLVAEGQEQIGRAHV